MVFIIKILNANGERKWNNNYSIFVSELRRINFLKVEIKLIINSICCR